jgi:signal transduction histidine kinase
LHDAIGQSLASVKIQTALLKKSITSAGQIDVDHVVQALDEIGRSIEETARSVKAISTELRPGVLDKFGLAAAIEWQCEETSRRLKIDCKANVPQQDLNIPPEISTALFRILQEALTNVAVHANADMIEVDLVVTDSAVSLVIADNGRGITSEEIKAPNSLGLLGMRERVECLKGSFSVSGAPGRGTTIRATFNLRNGTHNAAGDL